MKKNILSESFVPCSPGKIKNGGVGGGLMLACDSTPENSNCAGLKIGVIKVTDAVNFSDRTAYRRRWGGGGGGCVVGRCLARTPSELATVTTPGASI